MPRTMDMGVIASGESAATDGLAVSASPRSDIQALRGFAVLIVIFYHAKIDFFQAGYLGVDIFFVISGFLITRLVRGGIEAGSFSFSAFYFRRAKRLLPAAYVTLLASALLARFFLNAIELQDFRAQMAGAILFAANYVLLNQSGYFAADAELKPLLHFWSLAIEEQYYFWLPAALFWLPRRYWLHATFAILVVSLCVRAGGGTSDETFYLLTARAWELSMGSLGALMSRGARLDRMIRKAAWVALPVLIVVPLVKIANSYSLLATAAVCVSTLVLLMQENALISRYASAMGFSRIGDISYSLYLVHWPIFAFSNNCWMLAPGEAPPFALQASLIVVTFVFAIALNVYVEVPFRQSRIRASLRSLAAGLFASLAMIWIGFTLPWPAAGMRDYAEIKSVNFGFGRECEFGATFTPKPQCRNSDTPGMLLWGDSFAMHLAPGILASKAGAPALVQATRSFCGPLLGIAPIRSDTNEAWGERCMAFNQSVVTYLQGADSIHTIVLSSPLYQYLDTQGQLLVKSDRDGSLRVEENGLRVPMQALRKTVETVRALGKKVVFVAPPPRAAIDVGRCLERLDAGLPTFGAIDGCAIPLAAHLKQNAQTLAFLSAMPAQASVEAISFDSFLCDERLCKTRMDDVFIYRDIGHFSREGSVFVANAMSLVEKINAGAR